MSCGAVVSLPGEELAGSKLADAELELDRRGRGGPVSQPPALPGGRDLSIDRRSAPRESEDRGLLRSMGSLLRDPFAGPGAERDEEASSEEMSPWRDGPAKGSSAGEGGRSATSGDADFAEAGLEGGAPSSQPLSSKGPILERSLGGALRRLSEGLQRRETNVEERLAEGRSLLAAGELERAFEALSEVLLARPLDPEPLQDLERIAATTQTHGALADLYARLLQENPHHPSLGTLTRRIGRLRAMVALAPLPDPRGPWGADAGGVESTAQFELGAPVPEQGEEDPSRGWRGAASSLSEEEAGLRAALAVRSEEVSPPFGAAAQPHEANRGVGARERSEEVSPPFGAAAQPHEANRGVGARERSEEVSPPFSAAARPHEANLGVGAREHSEEASPRAALAAGTVEASAYDLGAQLFGADDEPAEAIDYELGTLLTSGIGADGRGAARASDRYGAVDGGHEAASPFGDRPGLVFLLRRGLAFGVDAILLGVVPLLILAVGTSSLSDSAGGFANHLARNATADGALLRAALLLAALFAFIYCTLCWALGGRTLGGFIAGLRAVDRESGGALSVGRAALRAGAAVIGTAAFLVGPLWALIDPAGEALHDKFTRSSVISG